MYVGLVHSGNTGPKRTADPLWRPHPAERIAAAVGADWLHAPKAAAAAAASQPVLTAETPARAPVCIGVHVHSEPHHLAETLAHLRANTATPFDILILGDGPDALTQAPVDRLDGCRRSNTAEPRGAAACFNRLLRGSDAELLVFLESGSLVGPGWLDAIAAALAADAANGLAGPSTNLAWGQQGTLRDVLIDPADVAAMSARLRSRFGGAWCGLEPLHCLADFCYAVRRTVVEVVGAADEAYGLGPCWEMDYTARAVRSGFRAVWAQSAYVFRHPFSARRTRDETRFFEASRRLYQDKFCGLRLTGARPGYARHCRGEECTHFAPADLIRRTVPFAAEILPTVAAPAVVSPPRPGAGAQLISCIMPTRGRPDWVRQSLRYFARQDYPERELIVIDDGADDLADILPPDPRIRHLYIARPLSIGAKRNLGCEAARGALIAHWDDDDWYGPDRLSAQAAPLIAETAEVSALADTLFFDLLRWRFWRCSPEVYARMFVQGVHGGTLMYRRTVFGGPLRYPNLSLAEDALFLQAALRRGARLARVASDELFAYVRHGANAWRFACGETYGAGGWRRAGEPVGFAADRSFYAQRAGQAAGPPPGHLPAGLPARAAEAPHG
jgi:GT2 family glycosyltransferase